jgi:hypothetical protein
MKFSCDDYPPDENYNLIPTGTYTFAIIDSTMRITKSGRGKCLTLECQIQGPTHRGRIVFVNLNVINDNDDAQRIARGTLSAIGRAVRVLNFDVGDDGVPALYGKLFTADVKIRKDKSAEYPDKNDLANFKTLEKAAITQRLVTTDEELQAAAAEAREADDGRIPF